MKYLDLRAAIRRRFAPSVGRRATSPWTSLQQASEPATQRTTPRPTARRTDTRSCRD